MRTLLSLSPVVLAAFVAPAAALAAATLMTPDQIKQTFGTGTPFTATSTTGGKTFTFTFNADGTAIQASKGANATPVSGKWRIDTKGYCSTWGTNPEHCYTVDKNGTRYDVKDSSGHIVSHWTL